MENRILKTKDLRLARVKYFDVKHNGAELTEHEVYAFLQQVGENYINIFRPEEELPVYGRAPYANVTRDGEDYGNRLIHLSGEVKDGPCYVMESVSVEDMIGREAIPYQELREYVLNSDKFFADRISLIQEERGTRRFRLASKLRSDMKKMDSFDAYLASHERQSVK